MRVSLLNGNPSAGEFDHYLDRLQEGLRKPGIELNTFCLREMNIRYCNGCFGCWVKTPGECVNRDESAVVNRAVINSDLTILASPIIMGFYSAVLKRTVDKFVPMVHPYIVIEQGEFHHKARYAHYPSLALILGRTPGSDDEDINIINRITRRTALNFKSGLAFTCMDDQPLEEVLNEINHI
jgi:multimeric flavodoxin WrbA